jgi:uncharacterized protein (DUF1330 family)
MKNCSFAVIAALAAGIGIGSFGVHSLRAQSNSPVYMVEDNTVIDPAGFANEFAPLARESLKTYGGRYLGGGGGLSIDGDPPKGRVVLVRWDSAESMMRWRHSPEYTDPRLVGDKYGRFRIFAVDGVPQ